MQVQELISSQAFQLVNEGNRTDRQISGVYCGDLLSMVMGHAPYGSAWVTVMSNVNSLAVLTLTDASCLILAEGVVLDDTAMARAKSEGITVFRTELPIFQAALEVHGRLYG